jgi:hypothetical protein
VSELPKWKVVNLLRTGYRAAGSGEPTLFPLALALETQLGLAV